MSRARLRLVAALLLAFAIWPLCHYGLVQRFRMNPWKFGGWAMYTLHVFRPHIQVFALDEGTRTELFLTETKLREAAAARDLLESQSREWGLLAPPDDLGQILREELEPSEGIEVVIRRFTIDPVPGRVSATRESYFYLADGRVLRELNN